MFVFKIIIQEIMMNITEELRQYVDYLRAVYQQDFALVEKLTQEGFIFESRNWVKILDYLLAVFKLLEPDTSSLCRLGLGPLGSVLSTPSCYQNTAELLEHSQYYRKLAEFQRASLQHKRKSSPQTQSHPQKELTCTSMPVKNLD
jgi:hypothetical protein